MSATETVTLTRDQIHEEQVLAQGNKWITESFLEELIRGDQEENIKVIEKTIAPAVQVGNNYLSTLIRVHVKYEENDSDVQEKSLIIKLLPAAAASVQMVEDLNVFAVELTMYNDVLPKMRRILSQFTDDEFFAPLSYKCEIPNTLTMEDLNVSGYLMVDRRDLLDFEHMASALKSIARFHAVSLAIKERDPETYESMSDWNGWMNNKARKTLEPYVNQQLDTHIEYLEKYGDEYKRFVEMLKKYKEDAFETMIGFAAHKSPNFIDVLCHGDTWLANMMFKYDDEGNINHVKLVDYQTCRLASPAFDVVHFLFSSAKPGVLPENMYKLVTIYHEALISDVQLLGLEQEMFTLNEFLLEMRAKSGYALFSVLMMLPNILLENDEILDMDKLDESLHIDDDNNPIIKIYTSPKRMALYEKVLKHYEDIGYIESTFESIVNIKRFNNDLD